MKRVLALVVAVVCAAPCYADDAEAARLNQRIRQLEEEVATLKSLWREHQPNSERLAVGLPQPAAATGQLQDISESLVDGFAQLKETKRLLDITGKLSVTAYALTPNQDRPRTGTFGPGAQRPVAWHPDTSDVMIEEFRLNFDAAINPHVKAHAAISFEDDLVANHAAAGDDTYYVGYYEPLSGGTGDTDMWNELYLDEAYLLIHDIADLGLYTILGKQYFPFGNQREYGHFIRDSQVRRVYETRDTGVTLGWTGELGPGRADVATFVFNGQSEHIPYQARAADRVRENTLDTFGVAGSYLYQGEGHSLKVGGGWLNNLYQANAPTDGFGWSPLPKFPTVTTLGYPAATYEEALPAYNLYAVGAIGGLWLSAEWVAAVANMGIDEGMVYDYSSQQPTVLTLEAAYTFPLCERDYTAAVRYEMLNDLEQLTGIETVLGASLSTLIFPHTKLSLDYYYYDLVSYGVEGGDMGDGNAHLYQANVTVDF